MSKILFCDWESDTGEYDSTSLFGATDLRRHDIIFFDPYGFTLRNGFREDRSDLRLAEYKSFTETEFLTYLTKIKSITGQIHEFLDSGGIWVIRATLPNSSIKVRKKSSAGPGSYTESVISFFFWLEEFLGTYSFPYHLGNTIKFTDSKSLLYQYFKDTPVDYLQTLDRMAKGEIEILARAPGTSAPPTMARVSFEANRGDIYLIPRFPAADEHTRLAAAFEQIFHDKKFGLYKPEWVLNHERRLTRVNPYVHKSEELAREIEKLNETRTAVENERKQVQSLSSLLYKTGDDLMEAVKKALGLIGFTFPHPPTAVVKTCFDLYARDARARQLIGLIAATGDSPVPLSEFIRFKEKLAACDLASHPKGIIIANAAYTIPPENRERWFADELIDQATPLDCCLLTTVELFQIVCHILQKTDTRQFETIKRSLQDDIFDCIGLFEMNRNKYLASAF